MSEPAEADASSGRRRGVMLVVSSPSGAGKTTLTRRLIEADSNIELSISVTTRRRRPGERDRHHYHFISVERFSEMRDRGELLEWADVFGHFYGTPREPVIAALEAGRDVLFDIDWQGAAQLRARMASDVVTVFILPPDAAELMARLVRRAQDPLDVIARRLEGAVQEIGHWHEYDYVIVNDDLDVAFDALRSALTAERLRTARRVGMADHVAHLTRDLESRLP